MALRALSVSELTGGPGDLVLDAGGRVMPVTFPQLTHTRWWCPVRSSASSNRVNASFAVMRLTSRYPVCLAW